MVGASLFRLRAGIGALSLTVLVLTLSFNALLSVSTLDRLVIESLLSGYRGAAEHLALNIERGLRFGKPLEKYAGMMEMLWELQDGVSGIACVEILDAEGGILHSTGGSAGQSDRSLSANRQTFDQRALAAEDDEAQTLFLATDNAYRLVIPLRHHGVAGGVALEVDASVVEAASAGFIRWATTLLVLACVVAGGVLAAWIGLLTSTPQARSGLARSLGILLLILIGGTQLAYSTAMLSLFDSFLQKAVVDKARLAAHFIKRDFEYLVHKGVDVRILPGGDALLAQIVDAHPELRGASLVTSDGQVLTAVGHPVAHGYVVETSVEAYWPSRFRQREEVMRIRLHTNPDHISANVFRLGVDLATSLVICLLFLMELAKMLVMLSGRMQRSLMTDDQQDPSPPLSSANALRAAGFFFFLAYDMGISFIPVLARSLHVPLWGLPEQVLTGLPISAEMICAGLALLGAGVFSERFGWRVTFAVGVLAACLGLFMGGASSSLPELIVARGVCGIGFGLVLMAAQIGSLEEKNAGSGLAGVFAGVFSGSICGAAIGAMLADRIGFELVFYAAAVLMPVALPTLLLGASGRKSREVETPPVESVHAVGAVWSFVRDPRMHVLLGMIGLPVAICLTGYLHYMLPLLLTEAQASQSDIGRVFMLYGLCFITVGPLLGRYLDRSDNKYLFAMLTGLLSGCALLIAASSSTLAVASLSVVVIGVAQCLAAPSTMLCVISLGSAQRLGREKTASIYRSLERLGQVCGPILFGTALVRFSPSLTLTVAGLAVCALALMYLAFRRISIQRR